MRFAKSVGQGTMDVEEQVEPWEVK
jgi:hypothetical protein